jgi:predicted enzyme related to lactoylglutathione lyase
MIKRLDRLEVAVTDLNDAASIYEKNFGFKVTRDDKDRASVTIGGAEIQLASGALASDALQANGEGMFGLWLEAENLEEVVASLRKGGRATASFTKENGRRILAIDPKIANQVPLFIFDRRG